MKQVINWDGFELLKLLVGLFIGAIVVIAALFALWLIIHVWPLLLIGAFLSACSKK
jgi:hypothetical protein